MKKSLSEATWDDLTELQPENTMTAIERNSFYPVHDERLMGWLNDGFLRLDGSKSLDFMNKIDDYVYFREQLPKDKLCPDNYWDGWHYPTSYLASPPMLELALSSVITKVISDLLHDFPLLHLALTGWISTERNWHQDSYLNPPDVWSNYVAVWIALDDIDPAAGPFQYVPGSHKWPVLRREKLFKYLSPAEAASPNWPTTTQDHVARVCEEEIKRLGARTEFFVPKKGEIFFWHSNLMHRGTKPANPSLLRKSLILHYSSANRRPDMARKVNFRSGYFFDGPRPPQKNMIGK